MQKIIFVILTIFILEVYGGSRSYSFRSWSSRSSSSGGSSSGQSTGSRSYKVSTYSKSVQEYVLCPVDREFPVPLHGIEVVPLQPFEGRYLTNKKIVAMPRDEVHAEDEILTDQENTAFVLRSTGNSYGDLATEDNFVFRPVARRYPHPCLFCANPCTSCPNPCPACPNPCPACPNPCPSCLF